jgi:tetratricopeptide (TPR) repeat protein
METVLALPAAKALRPEQLAVARLDLALLQRNYAAAEQALSATKAADFPGGGYVTPREWYAALVAAGLGQTEKAQAAFMAARERAAANVAKRPEDAKALMILAEVYARLDRREEAVRAGEQARALLPITEDALDGLRIVSRLAGLYGQVGETARALDLLQEATSKPSGPHYGELMLDERWDPLRKEPRFEKLLLSLAPKD